MKNIKFSTGTMAKFGEYYSLELFSKEGKKIYSATLDTKSAAGIVNKHNNIKMK